MNIITRKKKKNYICPTCKKVLCSELESLKEKWANLAFHYHTTHGIPTPVIFGAIEQVKNAGEI